MLNRFYVYIMEMRIIRDLLTSFKCILNRLLDSVRRLSKTLLIEFWYEPIYIYDYILFMSVEINSAFVL